MTRLRNIIGLLLVLALLLGNVPFFPQPAAADDGGIKDGGGFFPQPDQPHVPDEIIVKFKPGVDRQFQVQAAASLGAEEVYTSPYSGLKVLKIPEGKTVAEMVSEYSRLDIVEYAEPNYIEQIHWSPNDTYYSLQWHFDKINLEAAWDLDTAAPNYGGDPGIVVAVVDTGVAYENYGAFAQAPDLAGTTFVAGYDYVNSDAHPNDDNGHGTHVTGTIAQSTNDAYGVAGIAFNTSIMPVKSLGTGGGTHLQFSDAYHYAADNGARIINYSGGGSDSTTKSDAVAYARNAGVLVIASMGNDGDGTNDISYPAAYDDYVLAVAATDFANNWSYYSTYGACCDIAAPGGDTTADLNTDGYADGVLQQTYDTNNYPGDYTKFAWMFYQGTSMAAPHVSGVAALIWAKNPTWTAEQVRYALETTVTDRGSAGWDQYYGWGLMNAQAAVGVSLPPATSYNDAGHTSEQNNYSHPTDDHTVYMRATGLLPSQGYRMAYYDGANNKVATVGATSDGSGVLATQRTFVSATDTAGSWHVVVCDDAHTPPATYSSTWTYMMAEDTFTAEQAAIDGYINYTLTMAVNGSGSTTPAAGVHDYASGTVVDITATPDASNRFVNWSGDVASTTSNSTTVTINADKTVTANFEANTAPVLSSGNVTPTSGTVATTFTYGVIYSDSDNDTPASPYVSIDGEANQQMTKVGASDNYTAGVTYEYSTSGLVKGVAHTYQFSAADCWSDAATGDTGSNSGPTVNNSVPGAPVVDVTPDSPVTADDLTCTITTPSTDADGDAVTYSYAWYIGAALQAALTDNTVDAANTARDEVWKCVVTPNDGSDDGATAEDSVTIGNTAPVLSSGNVTPTSGTAITNFTYSVTYSDSDNNTPASPFVSVDGSANQSMTKKAGEDGDYTNGEVYEYTTNGLAKGSHTYQFSASDGTAAATGDTGVHSNEPAVSNSAPGAPVVDVTPDSPVTADDLLCTITTPSTDVDGDSVTYSYAWYKDTVLRAALTDNIIAAVNTARGQVWKVIVTPNDGTDDGATATDNVTIGNTAPSITAVAISPDPAWTDSDLTATPSGWSDADGDTAGYGYAWYKDDALQGALTSSTVAAANTAAGEVWKVIVTPTDGIDTGAPVEDTITITTAPSVIIISPTNGYTTTNASVTVSGNATATPALSEATMTVNGASRTITVSGGTFSENATLAKGNNLIEVSATNIAGSDSDNITVTRNAAPVVAISTPQHGARFGATPITVSGTVEATPAVATANITVNGGVPAVIAVTNGAYSSATVALTEGSNTIVVSATNAAGTGNATVTVNLNSAAPEVTITAPTDGSITNVAIDDVTGTVVDTPAISTANLTLNGVRRTIAVTADNFNEQITLVEGVNTIEVAATDSDNASSSSVSVTLDTAAPGVAITAPADNYVTSSANVTVRGTVDDSAVTEVTVTVNGADFAAAVSGGSFSRSVALNNGSNTIVATAVDAAGNTGSSGTITVTRDGTKPQVTVNSPSSGHVTGEANIDINGTVTCGTAVSSANVTLNGTSSPLTVTGGSFSKQVTLSPGVNTIVVNASDSAAPANTGSSGTITVTLDKQAPVVTITHPPEGVLLGTTAITITGTVDDGDVTQATLTLNGVDSTITVSDGAFSAAKTLVNGTNTIVVRASDAVGNTGASGTATVTVEAGKPTVTVDNPDTGLLTNVSSQPVSGTVEHTVDIDSMTINLNGTSSAVAFWESNSWSFGKDITLTEGVNTIVVRASDNASPANTGSSGVISVTLDTTAPAVTLTSPTQGQIVGGASVDVSGTVNDPGVTTANFTLNNTSRMIPVTAGAFSYNATSLNAGANTISVAATDGAGNTGSSGDVTVTSDSNTPVVTITSPDNGHRTNSASLTVSGTVVDATVITTATLTLNGVSSSVTVAGGAFSENVTLAAGSNTIVITASDGANTGSSGTITVGLDTTAPELTVSLSDPTDTVLITVSADESLQSAPTVSINPSIDMTFTGTNLWTGTYPATGVIESGNYTVSISGTDSAGNQGTADATFAKQTVTIPSGGTGQVTTATTTLEIDTSADVTGASVTVTQHSQNPAGGSDPNLDAGLFVEIVASPGLRDNLTSIYIQADYDETEITARGIDEATLRLYLWDVTTGQWQAVAGSAANVTGNFVYGTVTHLSEYGTFGTAPTPTPTPTPTPSPTPLSPGGGGGAASSTTTTVTPLMPGFTGDATFDIDKNNGMIKADFSVTSSDGNLTLTIPEGTTATLGGAAITALTGEVVNPSPPPPGSHIIGLAYDFGPDGAEFSPPISVTVTYDPASLPEGAAAANLALAYFDAQSGSWVTVPSTVDTVAGTVTGQVEHFTTFSVITAAGSAAAALVDFDVSELSVAPSRIAVGETVIISAAVANPGEKAANGAVTLTLNGEVIVSQEMTLDGGESRTLRYTVIGDLSGVTYLVDINGLEGEFTVKHQRSMAPILEPTPLPETPSAPLSPVLGLIIGLAVGGVLGGLGGYLLWRRRKEAK